MVDTPWGRWRSVEPAELLPLLAPMACRWWIAAGWAIDLFLGRRTREHEDVDVVVMRDDQAAARAVVRDWDVHAADPPGTLRPWPVGEHLAHPIQDVWCRPAPGKPWEFQFMLSDARDSALVFKRDSRIRVALDDLGFIDPVFGLSVMRPEIALLHKGTGSLSREKDDDDFRSALPSLDATARRWLHDALVLCRPGHRWLADLSYP